MSDCWVFLGPSLSLARAKQVLPDAIYLPPIQCGDILHLLPQAPKRIIIIDGLFERTASVWHKEILLALQMGVEVIGAASMGALRAAECAAFGMLGIGDIYQGFTSGELDRDADVAVLHSNPPQCLPLTIPFVDAKATIEFALQQQQINQQQAESLLALSRQLFYAKRTLAQLESKAYQSLGRSPAIKAFFAWWRQTGGVCQKAEDALSALYYAATQPVKAAEVSFKVEATIYLAALQRDISCQPLPLHLAQQMLPIEPRAEEPLQQRGSERLARLLASLYDIAAKQSDLAEPPHNILISNTLLAENPDSLSQKSLQRIRRIEALIYQLDYQAGRVSHYLANLLRLAGKFDGQKEDADAMIIACKSHEPEIYRMLRLTAICLCALENFAKQQGLVPAPEAIVGFFQHFCAQLQLDSGQKIERWLKKNHLDKSALTELVSSLWQYNHLILQHNLMLSISSELLAEVDWFNDALALSGICSQHQKMAQKG